MKSQQITAQYKRGFRPLFGLSGLFFLAGVTIAFTSPYIIRLIIVQPFSKYNAFTRYDTIHFLFGVILVSVGFLCLATVNALTSPPRNNLFEYAEARRNTTTAFKGKDEPKTLICLGDSITHGTCSANYVDIMSRILKGFDMNDQISSSMKCQIVNGGQNSICSWTVLHERLVHVLACDPDYIFILLGTNDVKGSYMSKWNQQSVRIWNLPEPCTLKNFERNMNEILDFLLSRTGAMIAVASLPPMGEDLQCSANEYVRQANVILKDVVTKHQKHDRVCFINIYDALGHAIMHESQKRLRYFPVDRFLGISVLMCIVRTTLGISWNTLSKLVGNKVMTDSLHLNEDGALIVAQSIIYWLKGRTAATNQ